MEEEKKDPVKCPQCALPEKKKPVCFHCGYEHKEEFEHPYALICLFVDLVCFYGLFALIRYFPTREWWHIPTSMLVGIVISGVAFGIWKVLKVPKKTEPENVSNR
jgi:hypothetical protein